MLELFFSKGNIYRVHFHKYVRVCGLLLFHCSVLVLWM